MKPRRLTRDEWRRLSGATDAAFQKVDEAIEKLRGRDAAENDEEMRLVHRLMAGKLLELWTGKTAG